MKPSTSYGYTTPPGNGRNDNDGKSFKRLVLFALCFYPVLFSAATGIWYVQRRLQGCQVGDMSDRRCSPIAYRSPGHAGELYRENSSALIQIYEAPSEKSPVLLELPSGTPITLLKRQKTANATVWYRVRQGTPEGWVPATHINLTQSSPLTTLPSIYIYQVRDIVKCGVRPGVRQPSFWFA